MKFAVVLLSLLLLCAVGGLYCLLSGLVPPRLTVFSFEVINPLSTAAKADYALARGACLVAWILTLFMLATALITGPRRSRRLSKLPRYRVRQESSKLLPELTRSRV